MYVLSTTNQRVSVQLLGNDKVYDKLSRFDELIVYHCHIWPLVPLESHLTLIIQCQVSLILEHSHFFANIKMNAHQPSNISDSVLFFGIKLQYQ